MKLIEILNEYDLRFKLEYDGVQKKWVATLRNDERSGCLMVIIKLHPPSNHRHLLRHI